MSHVLGHNRETTETIQVEPHYSGGQLKGQPCFSIGEHRQRLMWFYLLILGATIAVKCLF